MRWDGGPSSIRGILQVVLFCIALVAVPLFAQEQQPQQQQPQQQPQQQQQQPRPYNPPYPFLKPPPDPTPPAPVAPPPPPQPVAPPVPEHVTLPSGTSLNVVLETPLSTRIAKKGQRVTFRTSSPVHLSEGIDLPPDTAIHGTVIEARKPGGFGNTGVIRVKIDQIELPQNTLVPVVARLQSAETDKQGRIHSDTTRGTDLIQLGQYTLTGVLLGSRIGGGKGAVVGAGAGVLAALIIGMSHRGQDVYLEPGMPFVVVLDQSAELPGQQVFDAQESYARAHVASSASASGSGSESASDPNMTIPPNERPVLKHRPKKP